MTDGPARAAKILLVLLTLTLSGCTIVQRPLQPLGGSKADGTVTLGLEFGGFKQVQGDWGQGQRAATRLCRGWGYSGAQRFNDGMQTCIRWNEFGCVRTRVTVEYQCSGGSN